MSESPVGALVSSPENNTEGLLTSIKDGHGGAAEELTAGSTKLNLDYNH
jgi:hypothetical protein